MYELTMLRMMQPAMSLYEPCSAEVPSAAAVPLGDMTILSFFFPFLYRVLLFQNVTNINFNVLNILGLDDC